MNSKIGFIENTSHLKNVHKDFKNSSSGDFMETLTIMLLFSKGFKKYDLNHGLGWTFEEFLFNNIPIIDTGNKEPSLLFDGYINQYLSYRGIEVVNDNVHNDYDGYGEEDQEIIFRCGDELYEITVAKTSGTGFQVYERGNYILQSLKRVRQINAYETVWE